MNLRTYRIAAIILGSIIASTSCIEDVKETHLRRDTDAVAIAYNEGATTEVSVRYSGQWYARSEADWLNVTPNESAKEIGNGTDYQKLTITASRNTGESRTGDIYIISATGEEFKVEVTQEDGRFTLVNPTFAGTLVTNEPATGALVIAYQKAIGNENLVIDVQLGGVEGLNIAESTTHRIDAEGDGSISIPITGSPTGMGSVDFKVSIKVNGTEKLNKKITVAILSPNVIYSHGFDLFVYGGDYMNNKEGVCPRGRQSNNFDDIANGVELGPVSPGTDGVNDIFLTMKDNYRAIRNISGWTGAKVYERPGYIKIGVTAEGGWVQTSPITEIGETKNVILSVDLCRWDNCDEPIIISAEGAGNLIGGRLDTNALPFPTNAGERKWTTKTFVIEGASSETMLKFSAERVGIRTIQSRFFLDNIVIMTGETFKLTEQLSAVNAESIILDQVGNNLKLTWDAVEHASAYKVSIYNIESPNFKYSIETAEPNCTFENLATGNYTLEIQAISYSQPEFNSEISSIVVQIGDPNLPTLKIKTLLVNSTQIAVRWTISDYANHDADKADAYKLAVYKDAACTDLHNAFYFDANNSIWSDYRLIPYKGAVQFMISALEPNTNYWIKVTDTTYGDLVSKTLKVTTSVSPIITLPTSPAAAGQVILYEDFGEICFGGECVYGVPSWGLNKTNTYHENYRAFGDQTAMDGIKYAHPFQHSGLMNTFQWLVPNTRLKDWGASPENNKEGALCAAAGLIKIGASSCAAEIVTPTINCLEAGKTAIVEVSFDYCPYADPNNSDPDVFKYDVPEYIVQVYNNSTRQNEAKYINHEVGTRSDTQVHKWTVSVTDGDRTPYKWSRKTFEVEIVNGDAIGIGTYRSPESGTGQRRMYIDNVELKVKSYK